MRSVACALLLAASASVHCSGTFERCDEPDRSCGRPPATAGMSLATFRRTGPRSTRPAEDSPVDFRAFVVSAVDTLDEDMGGHVGNVWVQEVLAPGMPGAPAVNCPELPGGRGRVCAIQLFNAHLAPTGYHPMVGDLVDVTGGEYQEFSCATCAGGRGFPDGHFIPEVSGGRVTGSGVAPVPVPVPVTLAELEGNIDLYQGVLVELRDVTATGEPDCRGEIPLGGASTSVKLTQQLVAFPHGALRVDARPGRMCAGFSPPAMPDPERIRAGTRWERVVGIAGYFYGPKLTPRTPEDLVGQRVP